MGLFDAVSGALGGAGKAALIQMVLGMLSRDGNTSGGGLASLIQKFQGAGLGDTVASWISNGPNLPISAEQVQQVFGSDLIGSLAGRLGISPQTASSQLAETLPEAVDQMTPNGQLPEGGADAGGGGLGSLLGGFGSR